MTEFDVLDAPYGFTERPTTVPADLRTGWRVPAILLIVDKCWGRRASWVQMHVLSWFLISDIAIADARRILEGGIRLGEMTVGIDPAVNRAVDLAIGAGLLQRSAQRVEFTVDGARFLTSVRNSGALAVEAEFLDGIPGKVTEGQARQAFRAARP